MWFSSTILASVLDGGTFALTFLHKGSSSGQLFNSGVSYRFDQSECSTAMWSIMGSSAVSAFSVSIVLIAAVCTPLIMPRATL